MQKLTTKKVIAYLYMKLKKAKSDQINYLKNCIYTLQEMQKEGK